ncbi:MAG: HAD-IC family P-type ATPase [Theionarchaea archaeon]|nr:HAD-IC family P-type ATPase [Theionarchaea archaeon]
MEEHDNSSQKIPWHALSENELINKLDSTPHGLSTEQAEERLKKYGPNELEKAKETSKIKLIIKQITNPLIYLLLAATLLSVLTGHFIDAGAIIAVVILNTAMGTFQEWRADRALESLRQMASPHATVRRDGNEIVIPAGVVVPGDVLILETGDRVAADARLLNSEELTVNESALTGESEPVVKEPGQFPESHPLADRKNMIWMSTSITGGRGIAIVVSTGMNTAIGTIASEVKETKREKTPLQKRIHRLSIFIGGAAVGLATVVFILGILRSYNVGDIALFSVATAVSAIPEGLPAVISITLALGVKRMADQNAIIRQLPAVETLGSTTVICSDKTGTITKNEMTVVKAWVAGKTYSVTGEGYTPEGSIYREGEDDPLSEIPDDLNTLATIGGVANNAQLNHTDTWNILGTPSEGALLVFTRKAGINLHDLKIQQPRKKEFPFSSAHKYMATVHDVEEGNKMMYVKGAPERILQFCTHILENGEKVELDESKLRHIREINAAFANDALRVIAGAYRELIPAHDTLHIDRSTVENDLVFVGLWGMIDPPRPEAIEGIKNAQRAGIRIVMITGDHAGTAYAIARNVNIIQLGEQVMTGQQLDDISEDKLVERVKNIGAFARVSPMHKVKILDALKHNNEIVAMTGDGVNDAPALKGADIGISMGKTGTEVAKEASDMILTDDNFATIVNAVEEGRVIFNNLRRVIFFLITTNLGEIITLISALIIGLKLPLTAVMIIWINLITDGVCDVPLGIEPKHQNVLDIPPRSPDTGILDRSTLLRILILAPLIAIGTLGLFTYNLKIGSVAHAQTIAFTALAAFQWFNALNARSSRLSLFSIGLFSNRWLLGAIGGAILLQLLAIYSPPGQLIFNTTALSGLDWVLILSVTSSILIVDEILKQLKVYDIWK